MMTALSELIKMLKDEPDTFKQMKFFYKNCIPLISDRTFF